MRLFHRHRHRGPYVKVSYVNVSQPGLSMNSIGIWTRVIARCSDCGQIFEAQPLPGKWTLDELKAKA